MIKFLLYFSDKRKKCWLLEYLITVTFDYINDPIINTIHNSS